MSQGQTANLAQARLCDLALACSFCAVVNLYQGWAMQDRPDFARHYFELLGFFDYERPPQVLPRAGEVGDMWATAQHERMHSVLGNHTTLGLFLRSVVRREDRPRSVTEIAITIVDGVAEVQEGLATYIEYNALSQSTSLSGFREQLRKRPALYLRAFETALLVDSILPQSELSHHSPDSLIFLRQCLLIDICRFAMNVPIRQLSEVDALTFIRNNLPDERFRVILTTLASDRALRSALQKEAAPMFATWLEKSKSPYDHTHYTGISLGDHVEGVLAAQFASMPYERPSYALSEPFGLSAGNVTPAGESLENYLLRELEVELHLAPRKQLAFRPSLTWEAIRDGLARYSNDAAQGCYIRIVPNTTTGDLAVNAGATHRVPPGHSCLMIHQALFAFTPTGNRIWRYDGHGFATIVPTSSLPSLVSAATSQDVVFLLAADHADPASLSLAMALAACQSTLFCTTRAVGSLRILLTLIRSDVLSAAGLQLLLQPNWDHFNGAGTAQVRLLWVIPDRSPASMAFLAFVPPTTLAALQTWRATFGFPPRVRIVSHEDVGEVVTPPATQPRSREWHREDDIFFVPTNADIVSSHLLSFGW